MHNRITYNECFKSILFEAPLLSFRDFHQLPFWQCPNSIFNIDSFSDTRTKDVFKMKNDLQLYSHLFCQYELLFSTYL